MSPGRLFRGSEFPRLMILLALAAIGWPLACHYGGRPSAPEPAPQPIAEIAPLPPPDTSAPFAGMMDKTRLSIRDNAAYAELLRRARETPARALAEQSRRDVTLPDLLRRPERYRGLLIHVEGTAYQILRVEDVAPELSDQGHLFEAWTVATDGPRYPYCLILETPPQGLPGGRNLRERVGFDGYFLKLLAYDATDTTRVAPMMVGRLGWAPSQAATALVDGKPWLDQTWAGTGVTHRQALLGGLLLLMAVSCLRILWRLQGRPGRVRSSTRSTLTPSDAIESEALADWLAQSEPSSPPDEPHAEPEGPSPPD